MATEQISKSQFKAKALEYFRAVEESGEAIVVTDNGRPTVEVRPYRGDQRSPLERLRGTVIEYHAPTEPVAEDEWEALDRSAARMPGLRRPGPPIEPVHRRR